MPFIQGTDRKQSLLMPTYLDDCISEDNSVRAIEAFVESLNLRRLGFTKSDPSGPGAPKYNPKDMVKLYFYGHMNSIRSSRKLEKATYINIEIMWLINNLHPDHKTIADFRKENRKQLKKVFEQFISLCQDWGLIGGEIIAVDGTKFRADNSKRNNYNQKKIDRQLKYIEEKVEEYLKALEENDKKEADNTTFDVEEINKKLQELKGRKEFYENLEEELKTNNTNEISTTDSDARLMDNKKNGLEVNYNVQTAVDEKNKLIVAVDVNNTPSDQGHLNEMVQLAKENLGMNEKDKIEALADKGYYQANDLKKCEENETVTYVTHQSYSNGTGNSDYYSDKFKYNHEEDVYICPQGEKLHRVKHKKKEPDRINYKNYKACSKCPYKEKCTKASKGRTITRSKDQDFLDTVDARTMQNMDKYRLRQMIVEHPYGTVKRSMDSGYFLTRGLESVGGESYLIFAAYNMKRVINILGVKEIVRRLEAKMSHFLCKIKNSNIFLCIIDSEISHAVSA